jgi:hypothetical protein
LLELVIDLDDLFDERRLGVLARVGGEQPWGVGQQDHPIGPNQVGHQRGETIVVSEADLVVGHRVVLVHDRDHAKLEKMLKGLAGV